MRRILRPDLYHGLKKKPPFFEGWYYKIVDPSEQYIFAFIPGVFLHQDKQEQHSFVQVLEGKTGHTTYHRFRFEDFSAPADRFDLRVHNNSFRQVGMRIDLRSGATPIEGELRFLDTKPWPVTLSSPGIMGWYSWVPFMECYHGVLSLDHEIHGTLRIGEREVDFSGGRGYIEKDWGRSFPTAHIWMQTNHFSRPGISLTASVAIIPWIRSSFAGFIVGLLLDGRLFRFATYTGAKTSRLDCSDTDIIWSIVDNQHTLRLHAQRSHGGLLHAPTTQEMAKRLVESLTASIEVELQETNGRTIFRGVGRHGGLEVGGNIARLLELWKATTRA